MRELMEEKDGHIHNQGTQKDNLTKRDFKGLFWIFITFTIS